jgi:hypothetical protein
MATFFSRKLPIPLNPRLSHPSMCTPAHRISHHHKHHTCSVLVQVKRVGPDLTARGMRFFFHSDLARIMLTLHRDLDHAHADTNMSKRQPRPYRRFFLCSPPSNTRSTRRNGEKNEKTRLQDAEASPIRRSRSKRSKKKWYSTRKQNRRTPVRALWAEDRILLSSDTPYARSELAANATPTSPTPTQTCPSANPDATGDFFLISPPPKKRGAGSGGWARSSARQRKRDKCSYETK